MTRPVMMAILLALAAGPVRAENWVVTNVWTSDDPSLGQQAYAVDLDSLTANGDQREFLIVGVYRQRLALLNRPWDYDLMRWRVDCSSQTGSQSDYWPGSIEGGHHYHSDDWLYLNFDPVGDVDRGRYPGWPQDIAAFQQVCAPAGLKGQGHRGLTALVRALRQTWPEPTGSLTDRLGPRLSDLLGPELE